MIHAGYSELRKAFFTHSVNAKDDTSTSHNLLLFYAVESGLKSIYLSRTKLYTTKKIGDENLRNSHDLLLWIKELKLPFKVVEDCCQDLKLKRDGTHCAVRDAHQAWRYNIDIEEDDQKRLVQWMKKLKIWIQENM
jgi:hypothetical protein